MPPAPKIFRPKVESSAVDTRSPRASTGADTPFDHDAPGRTRPQGRAPGLPLIDLPAQVAHLYQVIEAQFPGEAVHLVGHSVGGAVAMLFAQAHGERVCSLVSVQGNFSLDDAFWSAAVARMSAREAEAMLAGFRADPAGWLASAGVAVDARSLGIAERWLAQQPAGTLQVMAVRWWR